MFTTSSILCHSGTSDAIIANNPSLVKAVFRERLEQERSKALLGGGQSRIDKQHARGSLTARERMELLFDQGTFSEVDQLKAHRCVDFGMGDESKQFPGDGIVAGYVVGLMNFQSYPHAFFQSSQLIMFYYTCVYLFSYGLINNRVVYAFSQGRW